MYRVAVCDDEENMLGYLCGQCDDILTEANIEHSIKAFSCAEELAGVIGDIDLLITDIELNDENGLELVKKLRAEGSALSVILVSGYEEYLRYGYSVQPVHFLLKPVSRPELKEALAADLRMRRRKDSAVLRSGAKIVTLPLNTFIYAESYDHNVLVHTDDGKKVFRTSLSDMERRMKDCPVFRCHNSYLVNMRRISEITGGGIELNDGTRLPIGRKYAGALRKRFVNYITDGE